MTDGVTSGITPLMFIKRNTKTYNGNQYHQYVLVETVRTERGPRHRSICSLGKTDFDLSTEESRKRFVHMLEKAQVGQLLMDREDLKLVDIVNKIEIFQKQNVSASQSVSDQVSDDLILPVKTNSVTLESAREAGSVHVGHQIWLKLSLEEILKEAGLDDRTRKLTEVLTLNRLVEPSSEHATPDWVARTALADILGEELDSLNYRHLYSNLDRLHPQREYIERSLAAKEASLFNLSETFYLYDLTSTYFEGSCDLNEKAKYGYSRDQRGDCKQVVVGLVLDPEGFPKAHEVFEGNRTDCTTVDDMIKALSLRTGKNGGATIIVDRGMSGEENLNCIRAAGHDYLVAAKQPERLHWLAEFEDEEGWTQVERIPSINNAAQHKTNIRVKRFEKGEEVFILCISEERIAKDKAIREKQEKRLVSDLEKLSKRVTEGKLKTDKKIFESIGRLKERYPRVARYYKIDYSETTGFSWKEDVSKKEKSENVDGSYILKTTRKDLTDEQAWKTYTLLTKVESAFRDLKGPLSVRPVFHHLEKRVESHIFICVLAYHLLVTIEKLLQCQNITESWETIRKKLSTHQVVSVKLPAKDGRVLEVRRDTSIDAEQKAIYTALQIPHSVYAKPRKRWVVS